MALFQPCTINSPFDGTLYNANMVLAEHSFADLGPYVISGLAISIGTGLSVNVASGTASIGGRVTIAGSFTIPGLTDNTTNHLWVLNTGAGTSNTSGTPPANSAKLGTCVTSGGVVTSVAMGRTSGRQQFVQPQNLVPGGPSAGTASAGHPDGLNFANWNLTDAEGKSCFGVLPAGAVTSASLPADVAYTDVANVFTHASGNTFKISDAATNTTPATVTVQHRTSAVPVSGFGAAIPFQFDNGANALKTFGQITSMVTTPTAGSEDGAVIFQIIHSGTLVETARARGVGMAPSGGFGGEWLNSGDFKHTGTSFGVFGAATVGQQTGASAAGIASITDSAAKAAITALQNALHNLGFVTAPA